MTRCVEQNVDWITDLIRYMRDHSYAAWFRPAGRG